MSRFVFDFHFISMPSVSIVIEPLNNHFTGNLGAHLIYCICFHFSFSDGNCESIVIGTVIGTIVNHLGIHLMNEEKS